MKKRILLSTVALALCAGMIVVPTGRAHAQEETGSLAYYPLSEAELHDHYYEWKTFLEYNTYREPCQHYREPPAGFVLKGCGVYRAESAATAVESPVAAVEPSMEEQPEAPPPLEVRHPLPTTIYFDFDRSNIRESEKEKLSGAIDEIKKENPAHVTVAGHADRAGPAEYNIELSQRRAKAVADEMVSGGIKEEVIDQKAYGETDLAVPTADGVPLQENRRTVIIDLEQ